MSDDPLVFVIVVLYLVDSCIPLLLLFFYISHLFDTSLYSLLLASVDVLFIGLVVCLYF